MKHLTNLLFAALLAVAFCACSSTQTITVHGTPGSQIYDPVGQNLGTIPPSGKIKVVLPDGHYFAYLLSQPYGADYRVPFALNFEYCNYTGARTARNLGYGIGTIGVGAGLMGTLMLLASGDDEDSFDTFATVAAIGAGVGLLGVGIGAPAESRLDQTAQQFKFKYMKSQNANTDIMLQPMAPYGEPKPRVLPAQQPSSSAASSAASSSSVARRQVSERSAKTLRNYGLQIEGTYVGSGMLTRSSEVLERYSDIKVILERVANDEVSVSVVESNGNEFFPNSSQYAVEKKADGSYLLVHEGVAAATITIDNTRKLVYLHPRVNIDGDLYTLQINATMK